MKCARIRKFILQSDVARLPEDILDHARQCPRCALVLRRTRALSGLLHLKTYEQPAPGSAGRCLAEVRDRIALQQAWPQHQDGRAVGFGFGWRFSFAAAFVALIGFNLITASRLPSFQPLVSHIEPAANRSFAEAVTNRMASSHPMFEALLASNRMDSLPRVSEPGGIYHQPSVSRPGAYYYQASYQEK